MRIRLAFAAITTTLLGVVACQPADTGQPVPSACESLAQLPAPDADHVSGKVMVRDAQADGATPTELREFCASSVELYPNW